VSGRLLIHYAAIVRYWQVHFFAHRRITTSILPHAANDRFETTVSKWSLAGSGRYHLSARHEVCLMQGSVIRTIDALPIDTSARANALSSSCSS
jgi:hypothetical protein